MHEPFSKAEAIRNGIAHIRREHGYQNDPQAIAKRYSQHAARAGHDRAAEYWNAVSKAR